MGLGVVLVKAIPPKIDFEVWDLEVAEYDRSTNMVLQYCFIVYLLQWDSSQFLKYGLAAQQIQPWPSKSKMANADNGQWLVEAVDQWWCLSLS